MLSIFANVSYWLFWQIYLAKISYTVGTTFLDLVSIESLEVSAHLLCIPFYIYCIFDFIENFCIFDVMR
jgi:hypothetical protein